MSNSRFVATVRAAFTVKEAQEFVGEIRKELAGADHHVYAFKIGHGASVSEGMSDDGEPPGTAGRPALAVVRGSDLGDVALVISRYFGGTKLGTGGLVAAYGNAAKAVFEVLETEEKIERVRLAVEVPYSSHGQVRRVLTEYECAIDEEQFDADVRIIFRIPEEHVDALTEAIGDLTAGRVAPMRLD